MQLSRKKEKKESEVAHFLSCPTLREPMDSSLHRAPPSMGFSRQEYWSGDACINSILTTCHHCSHFTDEETEA